jgi:hypothetical protein
LLVAGLNRRHLRGCLEGDGKNLAKLTVGLLRRWVNDLSASKLPHDPHGPSYPCRAPALPNRVASTLSQNLCVSRRQSKTLCRPQPFKARRTNQHKLCDAYAAHEL